MAFEVVDKKIKKSDAAPFQTRDGQERRRGFDVKGWRDAQHVWG